MKEVKKTHIYIVVALLLVSIACGISFDGDGEEEGLSDIELEQTRVSLEVTRSALSDNSPKQPEPDDSSNGDEDDNGQDAPDDDGGDGVCNRSKFVSETIPDNTVFEPGEKFDKTWTIRNAGTCDWTTDYTFEFTQGTRMGGVSSMNIPSVIEPNETITFKLNLTAPDDPGTYTGRWQIFAGDGEELGWYTVVIQVGGEEKPPAPDFAVTSVKLVNVITPVDITCPYGIEVVLSITANGPGDVRYSYRDDNTVDWQPSKTITFNEAGTKNITQNSTVFANGEFFAELNILDPNHQVFGPYSIFQLCAP